MTYNSQLGDGDFLRRAYALQSATEARDLYDQWATSYDIDLEKESYAFPERAATALYQAVGDFASLKILDAGCGTGMVGVSLRKLGARDITGIDISAGMLSVAEKTGAYRETKEADLTKPINAESNAFDAVICVGTLTRGHVGPAVLDEFVRVVKPSGFVVATVLEDIWESNGFKSKVEQLGQNAVEVSRSELIGVVESKSDGGRLLVLKKML